MSLVMERETVLDLLGGGGIGAIGLDRYFDVVEAVERAHEPAQAYAANHRQTAVREMDVFDFWAGRKDFDGIRGMWGSPVCQGSSFLNQKAHVGKRRIHQDPRNEMTGRLAELVARVQPEWCVFENVPSIPEEQRERAALAFRRMGYNVQLLVLNAADYGAAQRRKRWIMIATRPGRKVRPLVEQPAMTVREAFATIPVGMPLSYVKTGEKQQAVYAKVPATGTWQRSGLRSWGDVCRLAWDEPAPAITNPSKCYYIAPDENRVITLEEALTLFGAPGSYKLFGTCIQKGQVIANGVPAPLAEAIARSIALEAN